MNRTERRAATRAHRRAGQRPSDRQSYKLPPQVCTLYVPAAAGYLVDFTPQGFRVVDAAEHARLYLDDEASSAALAFKAATGLRVAIRPYYCPHR